MANKLDLANAQFIGFNQGKDNWDGILDLVKSMKLTKSNWNKWKKNYTNVLDFGDYKAIEDHFNKKSKKNKYEKNIDEFC